MTGERRCKTVAISSSTACWQKLSRLRESELRFRGVDPMRLRRGAPLNEQIGESAVATADAYPAQASGRRQPIEELPARELAPDAHYALVDIPVVETIDWPAIGVNLLLPVRP
jgi:hypothetical protein